MLIPRPHSLGEEKLMQKSTDDGPRWTETACIYLISVLISSKCNYKAGVALRQNYVAV